MKIDITSGQLIVASGCYGYSSAISSLIITTAFSHNRYTTPGQRISARSIVVRETHSQMKQTKIDYRPPCFPTRILFLKLGRGCWPDDPKKQLPPPLSLPVERDHFMYEREKEKSYHRQVTNRQTWLRHCEIYKWINQFNMKFSGEL